MDYEIIRCDHRGADKATSVIKKVSVLPCCVNLGDLAHVELELAKLIAVEADDVLSHPVDAATRPLPRGRPYPVGRVAEWQPFEGLSAFELLFCRVKRRLHMRQGVVGRCVGLLSLVGSIRVNALAKKQHPKRHGHDPNSDTAASIERPPPHDAESMLAVRNIKKSGLRGSEHALELPTSALANAPIPIYMVGRGSLLNMRNVLIAVCMVALMTVAACKKRKTTPPPPELSVSLIEPGQAPREVLQYSIPPETALRSLLTVRDVAAGRDQSEYADKAFGVEPGMRLHLRAGPTVSLPNGIRYILRIASAESILPEGLSSRQIQEAQRGVQALDGMRGRFDLNRQGIVVDSEVPWAQGHERIHPRVAITIGNVRSAVATIPLPREPIGPGAVWEVRRRLRIWSARVTQVTRYELIERQGDRLRVAIRVQQTAAPQVADLNPRLEMHVRSYQLRATGNALADLGLPIALEAELQSTAAADIALVSPDSTQPLVSTRRSVVRLRSRRPEQRKVSE